MKFASPLRSIEKIFGGWRVEWLDPVTLQLATPQDLPTLLAARFQLDARSAWLACATVGAGSLALFALSSRDNWRPGPLLGSIAIGACIVAGSPLVNDVLKCQLKPVSVADYAVPFSGAEETRLKSIFPNGVCDWSKPSAGQQPLRGTYLRLPLG